MKRSGSTFIITKHSEVLEYFYSPTNWDFAPGNRNIAAISIAYYHYKLSEEYVENCNPTLEFYSDWLEEHWNGLCESVKYAQYSFTKGEQLDIEDTWHSEYRDNQNNYLLIAKHIKDTGIDNFTYVLEDGEDCSKILVTNKSGNTFSIIDTVDLEMYLSLKNAITRELKRKETTKELNSAFDFIKTS